MTSKLLRIAAAILIAAAVLVWLSAGANPGWSKTSVPVKLLDEITGIEGITYERRFVPGVDFIAGACLLSAVLTGISFFAPRKRATKPVPH